MQRSALMLLLAVASTATITTISAPAWAADPKPKAAATAKKTTPAKAAAPAAAEDPNAKVPTMTRAELRACMDLKDEVESRHAAYTAAAKTFEQETAAIKVEGEGISAAQPLVDMKSAESIAAFNKRIAEHNAKLEEHNAKGPAVEALGNEAQTASKRQVADCSEKQYLVGDREAVLRERAARPAAAASAVTP